MNPEDITLPALDTNAHVLDVPPAPDVSQPAQDVALTAPAPVTVEVPAVPAEPAHVEETVAFGNVPAPHDYPSLYDTKGTTVVAVLLGMSIIGGILYTVHRIYRSARDEHQALTQFVTTMVALVVGAYMTDLLIAGPDTSLLSDEEHTTILGFIKDVCLMVFSYYFGTRASGSPSVPPTSSQE